MESGKNLIVLAMALSIAAALPAAPAQGAPFDTQTKLTASDGVSYDCFGSSVGLSSNTGVVGAYGDDGTAGSAYIYDRDQGGTDNWGEVVKFSASDGMMGDYFGWSAGISGDIAVVGSPWDDDEDASLLDSGSAYIYDRNYDPLGDGRTGWGQRYKLTASDATAGNWFGNSVGISGNTAIVGERDGEAAYLFNATSGGQVGKLTASDAGGGGSEGWDRFGFSVDISGETAIVGAHLDGEELELPLCLSDYGSAYLFDTTSGAELAKLIASDPGEDDWFGWSVSISGDTAIVGALYDDIGGSTDAGSAYIFERNEGGTDNWGQVAKLTHVAPSSHSFFGFSVAIDGDTAIVGAHWDNLGGYSNSGSAHIFQRDLGGEDNWGLLRLIGSSDVAADDVFGYSVAIDGYTAFVGEPGDDEAAGAAHIFTPEPATLGLLILGGLAVLKRRRA